MKIQENGRSMIEMLGVLAIVGVLSVGGIAAYSKAMTKFKINKSIEQINMIRENIYTLYSGQNDYHGLNNGALIKAGGVPQEMYKKSSAEYTEKYPLFNPFGGTFAIAPGSGQRSANRTNLNAFLVSTGGIPYEACVELLSISWGDEKGDSLVGIKINQQAWRSDAAPTEVTDENLAIRGDIGKWDGTQYFGTVYRKDYGVKLSMDMITKVCGAKKTTITYKFK